PRLGYVWEQEDGTLYQGGAVDSAQLLELVALLRQTGIVALAFRENDPMLDIFPPQPDAGAECLELERAASGSDLTPHLQLPAGYQVFHLSYELIEKSPRLGDTLARYVGLESYLESGLGICLLHGDEYVCTARADMEVDKVREVGIITEPAHRGRGLGTIAVAHLLNWCDELGCSTYWDCARYNIGSVKIAHKLGYGNQREYRLLAWFPPRKEVRIG
ncbi:MAG: GNAT family N-acetyltransferase, partial [Anaerolineae bacterium]|nr:GNAT family N-acetyltransferase [Anaerolineae bacterium]